MAYPRRCEPRAPPSGGDIIDSMGELDLDSEYWSAGGVAMEEEDEILASNEGSEEDKYFDSIVGALEEAVMDSAFANLQQSFVDEWCEEFDDVEENKLTYTNIFRQYTQLVERHLDGWLRQRVRGFEMEAFMKMVAERQDEIVGDVIDILTASGDFVEFKHMMVAHRKGRDNGLTVRSAPAGMAPAETRRYQEEKMGIGGLAIQTAASAEGALVRQASTL
ncbi:unnamed protein product, partial [Pylaiella littoralis]